MGIEEFALRVGAALLSGLLIGIEREIQNKNAGIKTNGLVALGSSIFVLVSLEFRGEQFVDITRVLGQVVTGIGFIGAGVILHKGTVVRGLTTAATVWCSAAAGCIAAMGDFEKLMVITALIVLINVVFGPIDRFIRNRFNKSATERKED